MEFAFTEEQQMIRETAAQFLADDMAAGPLESPGRMVTLSGRPGIGVEPDPEKVARYRVKE